MSYFSYQLFTFYGDSIMKLWIFANIQRKEEGKDQESIQSSTTPDPGHHMGKRKNAGKHHIQESQEVSPFPTGDHNVAGNRHDYINSPFKS